MSKPYQVIKEELDKTSVISQEFKTWILSWVLRAIEEAYNRGREVGENHE